MERENIYALSDYEMEGGHMKILLKNAKIATFNKKNEILENADLLIKDRRIEKIGRNLSLSADKVIQCDGKLVMPGLVNSHLHSDENMFRGLFDNLPLEPWMLYSCPPLMYGPFSTRLIYLRTMVGAMEMVRKGITCFQDDVSECPKGTFEGYDSVFQAYEDLGIRGNIALNMGNRKYLDKLPYTREFIPEAYQKQLSEAPDQEEMFSLYDAIIKKWNNKNGMKVVFSTSAPQRCTDEYLMRALDYAEKYDLPMHTHILETRMQRVTGTEFYGKSIVQHIKDLGFLTDRLTIIHGVWMDDADMEAIGQAGASVAHNPVSNLKLGSGIMPLRHQLDHGVNVVLGTDGMSSNDGYSIFETLKFTALLQKVMDPDYKTWRSAKDILDLAIKTPAHSLRREGEIGGLTEGLDADLIIVNLRSEAFTPLNDIYKHLVYCEDGADVETIISAGKIVMEQGRLLHVDEQALLAELADMTEEFQERFKETVKENDKLMPYIDGIYNKCINACHEYTCNLFV